MAISLKKMIDAGAHYGHHKSKKNPHFEKYVFATKNNVSIINLEITQDLFAKATEFLKEQIKQGKKILFVGTKKQAQNVIADIAESLKMPYLNNRWLGGAITNFKTLKNSIDKYKKLKEDQKAGKWSEITKKERLILERKLKKMEVDFQGLSDLDSLPEILFVVDPANEKIAVSEAKKKKIVIVALVDTNYNPDEIDYPIPMNDDSIKAVRLFMEEIGAELKNIKTKNI